MLLIWAPIRLPTLPTYLTIQVDSDIRFINPYQTTYPSNRSYIRLPTHPTDHARLPTHPADHLPDYLPIQQIIPDYLLIQQIIPNYLLIKQIIPDYLPIQQIIPDYLPIQQIIPDYLNIQQIIPDYLPIQQIIPDYLPFQQIIYQTTYPSNWSYSRLPTHPSNHTRFNYPSIITYQIQPERRIQITCYKSE